MPIDDTATIEQLVAAYQAGEIDAPTLAARMATAHADAHAAQYPAGCPGASCQACHKRLGGARAICPTCHREMPTIAGRILDHDAPVRAGRAGYSRRHYANFAPRCGA